MNKNTKIFVKLVIIILIVGVIKFGFYQTKEKPAAVVWAGSDYQYKSEDSSYILDADENSRILKELNNRIKKSGYRKVDEALFCGDMTPEKGKEASDYGAGMIEKSLEAVWGLSEEEIIFNQGNHDAAGFEYNDATGGYEREYYSVYNINYKNFKQNDSETNMLNTAGRLKEWLNWKCQSGDTKPIFIISHLPLHHSGRGDNDYTKHLVDVLNEAAKKGLNIIFLFGHNHSDGYDRYLGGSCVYYEKGDTILVSSVDELGIREYTEVELEFIYMNAGYVGEVNTGEEDATLSASIFEIYEDCIEISRYNSKGICNLKNAGSHSGTFDMSEGEFLWEIDDTIAEGEKIIPLNKSVMSLDENVNLFRIQQGEKKELGISVKGMNTEYSIEWKCLDEKIAKVSSREKNVKKAMVIGKQYGTTKIIISLWNEKDEKVAETSVDIAVVPEDAELYNGNGKVKLYRKVQEQEEIKVGKKYMILNTDELSEAKALGGAGFRGEKDGDPRLMVRTVEVFQLSDSEGKEMVYTSPASEYDTWKIEEDNEGNIYLKLARIPAYFAAIAPVVDQSVEPYPYKGNFRFSSSTKSNGTLLWSLSPEQGYPFITAKHYSPEEENVINNSGGEFRLTYHPDGYFSLINDERGEPIYLYEEDQNLEHVWVWGDTEKIFLINGEMRDGQVAR